MLSKKQMGIRTLISGFILYFILAFYYLLQRIIKYLISCLNHYNGYTELDDYIGYIMNVSTKNYLIIIYSLSYIVNNVFIGIGIVLNLFCNINTALLIGISLILTILSNFFLILTKNIIILIISTMIISACNGIVSLPILFDVIKYFPRMKCLSISFILSGFSIANIFYEKIFDSIFNSHLNDINNYHKSDVEKIFIIYGAIKSFLKTLSIIICILSSLCICLIYPYDIYIKYFDYSEEIFAITTKKFTMKLFNYQCKNNFFSINNNHYNSDLTNSNNTNNDEEPFLSLISSCPFIQLIFLHFSSLFFNVINSQLLQKFGYFNEYPKEYIQTVEKISLLANFIFYFIFGVLLERIKFRRIYVTVILIQIFTISSWYFFSNKKIGFLLYNLIYSIVQPGNLILVPNSFFSIFGVKKGILLLGISSILINIYNLIKLFIEDILIQKINYLMINLVIMSFLILAFLIISVFIEKKHVYKYDENQNKIEEMSEIDVFDNDYETHEINELNDFGK